MSKCGLHHGLKLTQYGHHHVVLKNLYRASGNKVESGEYIATVDQSVTWRCVGGLESHGQSPQTAFVGTSKGFAVLQQGAVQMEADVSLQALGETL